MGQPLLAYFSNIISTAKPHHSTDRATFLAYFPNFISIAKPRHSTDRATLRTGLFAQVVMLYTVGIAAALLCFQAVPASMSALQWLNVFMIGFFL